MYPFSRQSYCLFTNHRIHSSVYKGLTKNTGSQRVKLLNKHSCYMKRFVCSTTSSSLQQHKQLHTGLKSSLFCEEDINKDLSVFQLEDDIVKVSFSRPQKANAMGKSMLSQLHDIISALNSDEGNSVRCLILTSCSDNVFSAGADLKERSTMTMDEAASFVTSLRSALNGLAILPIPLIACIEGAALGGGFEIALTADVIVAGKNAKFGLPETSLAIIPGAGGTQRLPRLIGSARAKDLIFTGRKIDAQTAHEYGIVQHLVEAGEAESKGIELGKSIAMNGPLAIRAAKRAVNEGINTDITAGMDIEKACYGSIIPTRDRLEGLSAFKEKRKPIYKGY